MVATMPRNPDSAATTPTTPRRTRRSAAPVTYPLGRAVRDVDALPEPLRQAVVDAVAGRNNVRAFVVPGKGIGGVEVVIRNR